MPKNVKPHETKVSFSQLETLHKFPADEIISALQKSIRRGDEDGAVFFAYELFVSGGRFEEKCWERLRVSAVEDIGLADPSLVNTVANLHAMYNSLAEDDREDKFLQGLFAVILLTKAPKSRYVDEVYTNLRDKVGEGYRVEVPDYALDKHTKRGRALGRGADHFWKIAALLVGEIPGDKRHLKNILLRIDNE